jgi:hypothetical protein
MAVGKHSRLLRLQSAHTLLGSNFRRFLMVCWFCAARSAAGFGGRRDMAGCGRVAGQLRCPLVEVEYEGR